MSKAAANGLNIEYETFGNSADRPLILIAGLGSQLVSWPDEFCMKLASAGHFVIRFDNRDTGLSTKFDNNNGSALKMPYTLSDMALDTTGLMDALEIQKAHICGISMGGMIAQAMAIEHPGRMLSLISMESTTGEPDLPKGDSEVINFLFKKAPDQRDLYIEYHLELNRLFAGTSAFLDKNLVKKIASLSFDRAFYPQGIARQYSAVISSGSRRKALASVKLPALILHGDCDPLFSLEHGQDIADAIENSDLKIINGLGHGIFYPELWDEIISAITDCTALSHN